MKRGPNELNIINKITHTKKAKIIKYKPSTEVLLEEFKGHYSNFKKSLAKSACKHVEFNLNFYEGDNDQLIHIGQALKGTNATRINISCNKIGRYPLSIIQQFGLSLKNTSITNVCLYYNEIDSQHAQTFAKSLKEANVTHVNLFGNDIDNNGAENLLEALNGTLVNTVNLSQNPIDNSNVATMVELIKKTVLIKLNLPFSDPAITAALKTNHEQLFLTPYYMSRLSFLSGELKESFQSKPALSEQSSNDEQLQYAGGILMKVPTEIAHHALRFLPGMNAKILRNIFDEAKKNADNADNADNEEKPIMALQNL